MTTLAPQELMRRVQEAPSEQAFMSGLCEVARHDAIAAIKSLQSINPDNVDAFEPEVWVTIAGQAQRLASSSSLVHTYGETYGKGSGR